MTEVRWASIGIPVPQGSKRHVGNGIMIEQSATLPAWRNQLIYDIQRAAKNIKFEAGVNVTLDFRFPRPKSHYRTGKYSHLLKETAPIYKTSKPDLDKIIRAVMDAMTYSGVIKDDANCYLVLSRKMYCNDEEQPGVYGIIADCTNHANIDLRDI